MALVKTDPVSSDAGMPKPPCDGRSNIPPRSTVSGRRAARYRSWPSNLCAHGLRDDREPHRLHGEDVSHRTLTRGSQQWYIDITKRSPTALLLAWRAGEQAAFDELLPLVYDELRRLARRALSAERSDHTLQASALVHEAYIRLLEINRIDWQDRAHFFAFAARVMRRVLVDWARARKVRRRGGGAAVLSLDEALVGSVDASPDLVALDDALNSLATIDERKAQVVEMRFFGGMSVEETAVLLQVSPGTVLRDWRLAKVWLLRELSGRD